MFLSDKLQITTEREYTDEGFLKVPARISRTGIQEYLAVEMGLSDREPTDKIKVYRPEEEVFSDISLSSFASKPVTNNHPPELVNASNSKQYSVGMSDAQITRDGDFVKTILYVTDAEAISNIESGKVELSNGYTADIDWTPGVTPSGETYDAIQRNIKGNHIAIVERGRAGPSCRVADNSPMSGEVIMAKATIDGVDYEVSDQAAQAVGKLHKRLNDAEEEAKKKDEELEKKDEELKAKEDEMEEAEKEARKTEDSLKAQLDTAKSKVPSQKTIDKMVADRMALIDSVRKVCPDIVVDGKGSFELMAEAVKTCCPNVQMDSVSDDYIKARFDSLVESAEGNSQYAVDYALSQQVKNKVNDKGEDNRPESVIARDKAIEASRNAWKFGGRKQ